MSVGQAGVLLPMQDNSGTPYFLGGGPKLYFGLDPIDPQSSTYSTFFMIMNNDQNIDKTI